MKKYLLLPGITLLLLVALLMGCTGDNTPIETTASADSAPAETSTDVTDVTAPAESSTEEPASSEETTTAAEEPTEDYFEANRVERVEPDATRVPDMTVTDTGYDVYRIAEGQEWGYRYGCTYLYNDDGSIDAYFACVGSVSGEWDWISYRHSPDGGKTWSDEKIVLTPTQGSMDHFSNCDPGVVYFDGYYYLGYTSTLNAKGACNNVFVARSENPDGPFEKWNGNGWGGYAPQPILYYDLDYDKFGIGEPSFVELNGTLYIYYSLISPAGEYMMVSTADATDENWPATMQNHGVAVKKSTDSVDVKYVEEWGKFIGVATGDRMGPNSWLGVYESNDGLTFELVDVVREGTYSHLHNAGLSSRRNGHIRLTEDADKLRVIYAYGEGWGTWNTRVQPVTLQLSAGNDLNTERMKPCLADEHLRAPLLPEEARSIAMIRADKDVYRYHLGRGSFTVRINAYDTYFDKLNSTRSLDLKFKVYDESVCTIDQATRKVTIQGVGITPVEVRYGELCSVFFIEITAEPENLGKPTEAVELVPVRDTYTLYLEERSLYHPQLRARMHWADGSFTEFYVEQSDVAVTFMGYDEAVISVSDRGVVTAKQVGETSVTVTCRGKTCVIRVVVTDNPEDAYFQLKDFFEIDYENLDFSRKGTEEAITSTNSASLTYHVGEEALEAVVTGNDALFYLGYAQSATPLKAEDYKAVEVVYKCPADTSARAVDFQMFICVGDVTSPSPQYQVKQRLIKDGEYHTLTIDVSALSYWTGDIHTLRMDFFDQSETGDTMYIKSIRLIRK